MFFSKEFKKFKDIKHCFFSRKNGFSKGLYRSLNCGKGSKDNKINILKNLKFVAKNLKLNKKNLILMNQTHGNKIIVVNNKNKKKKKFNSDALITKLKGLGLCVLTADCVPIILYDKNNKTIACIHAGWKGAFSGIIEKTINKLKKMNKQNNIYACVGPCIGKRSYEVDNDLFQLFINKKKNNSLFFTKKKNRKFFFNIRGYVNKKLKDCGTIKIQNLNIDTFADSSNFFSYRRSVKIGEKDYGRCISVISML